MSSISEIRGFPVERPLKGCALSPHAQQGGSILLEVVLALALFVAAATIISSGLNASVEAVHRLRQNTHAMNLAITVMSEMQMHSRAVQSAGPENFAAPFEGWSWQVEVAPLDDTAADSEGMRRVEVVIGHSEDNVVQRLAQFFRASDIMPGRAEGSSTSSTGSTGSNTAIGGAP